ncbi:S-adenosylmethionine:tRNA ribosyltransferase-isomerase [Candidatus Rubidus massiliensis]|nr:S-adenosylmethionine:tRNA ribosyltransferase-isomerase [Candidatus Rubidus massiliensis]
MYSLSDYSYDLPEELIAQYPSQKRETSRLLIVDRSTQNFLEIPFFELKNFLNKGDELIFNNTKVFPCRFLGKRKGGGIAEVFLLKKRETNVWEALVKPGRKLGKDTKVFIEDEIALDIIDELENGIRLIRIPSNIDEEFFFNKYGKIPLPTYINRPSDQNFDQERYQTVYAQHTGSVAAPTAGLHFSENLIKELAEKGINQHNITLHVGLGTFQPVKTENIIEHKMHQETYSIEDSVAECLNRPLPHRRICVGTTTCRALESNKQHFKKIVSGIYQTDIFIYPGYNFVYVDHLLTNFHAPRSSLLMLVSAFAGYDLIKEAYQKAIKDKFRFFSYGDAMLIL